MFGVAALIMDIVCLVAYSTFAVICLRIAINTWKRFRCQQPIFSSLVTTLFAYFISEILGSIYNIAFDVYGI